MKRALTVLGLLAAVGVMTGLVSYSVTLYRLFCAVTGAGGTPQRVAADEAKTAARMVTVFFNTDTAPGLPWRFEPKQRSIRVHLGEQALVFFEATNLSDQPIVGHATFNVTPDKVGIYFKKIQCFCFTEERLGPHQHVEMPVTFYVDPALATDPGTEEVDQITLSYTFFRSARPEGAEDLSRFDKPDPERGALLFANQCSGCHLPETAKIGPPLAGVVGRPAAAVPGYPYSAALAHSGLVWDEATLERWLAGPQNLVPGAAMPMAVPDAAARRDIIAYLKTLQPGSAASTPSAPPGPANAQKAGQPAG
jgi:cytochrome c oxidase assembly protein subunit 11